MTARVVVAALACLVIAGCGSVRDLKPAMGHDLPPPPYGRQYRPSPAELLELPAQAAPTRSDELRKQSEERADDPFDLPPEDAPHKG